MEELFDFSEALNCLKNDRRVARKGWNGKKLTIIFEPGHTEMNVIFGPHLEICNENTHKVDTWVPSISDLFAEDWYIV